MENFTLSHQVNIILHVTAGTLALLAGTLAIFSTKQSGFHRTTGRIFLCLMAVVVITGLIGVLLFARNTFLLVITSLSGYMAFSGYRTVTNRNNVFYLLDGAAIVVALGAALYFINRFAVAGIIWSPVIVYSTVGYLLFALAYDTSRYFLSKRIYTNLWLYEHFMKMISAFSGLLSAFTGTVLPHYQPHSQFLPSVAGTLLAIVFMISAYRRHKHKRQLK